MKKINKINNQKEAVLIIPDVRSALNVGALFRTADAVGVTKIFLVGYTPCPTDTFGRIQKDIAKSALGAETWISWEYRKTLIPLLTSLKKEGYHIVALEQDECSLDYRTFHSPDKIAFIVGPEVEGLPKNVLIACDTIVSIPMHGKKESLNVSVACGVALFRILQP